MEKMMLEESSTKILEIDGIPLSKEEVGELHVRGRNVMRDYYRAPELTAKVIDSEGWFNSGDLARFNGNRLYIVGRTPARCESMSSRPVCMATDLLSGRR
jgi:long-subunit acyl-CoA synthetase (AMP-forming)